MTLGLTEPRSDATSAAGAMCAPVRQPGLAGLIVVGGLGLMGSLGTSTGPGLPAEFAAKLPALPMQTSAGVSLATATHAASAIAELRRLSGLTWDQLARLFHVSRRSLHFWASGKPLTPANEEHLQRVLAAVRKVNRGSASDNRAALLAVRDDGVIPFDLLAAGQYEAVVQLLGAGQSAARVSLRLSDLSDDAKSARAPRPPADLVDALPERVARAPAAVRAAKSVRIRGEG